MANVEVSKESLETMKKALCKYKKDIELIPDSIKKHNEQIRDRCAANVKKLKNKVEQMELSVKESEKIINQLSLEYSNVSSSLEQEKKRVNQVESEILRAQDREVSLESQLSSLHNELAHAESDEEAQSLQRRIEDVRTTLVTTRNQKYELQREKEQCMYQVKLLEKKKIETHHRLNEEQARLKGLKEETKRLQNKSERLKKSFEKVESEADGLRDATNEFSQFALEKTSSNLSGLDQCITQIETYLSVNL